MQEWAFCAIRKFDADTKIVCGQSWRMFLNLTRTTSSNPDHKQFGFSIGIAEEKMPSHAHVVGWSMMGHQLEKLNHEEDLAECACLEFLEIHPIMLNHTFPAAIDRGVREHPAIAEVCPGLWE